MTFYLRIFPPCCCMHFLFSNIYATCSDHLILPYLIVRIILCLWFRASLIYINNCPTRCNTKQPIYYSASSLYMFRLSTTPIIRSTQNCNYSLRYGSYFLCSYLPPTWPTWPLWREVAAQHSMTSTGGCSYSFVYS